VNQKTMHALGAMCIAGTILLASCHAHRRSPDLAPPPESTESVSEQSRICRYGTPSPNARTLSPTEPSELLPFPPLQDLIRTSRDAEQSEIDRRLADEVLPSAQREGEVYRVRGRIVRGTEFHGICMRFSDEETLYGKKKCQSAFNIDFMGACDGMFVELEGIPYNASTTFGTLSILMVTWARGSVAPPPEMH
jgi:hypothetical protein